MAVGKGSEDEVLAQPREGFGNLRPSVKVVPAMNKLPPDIGVIDPAWVILNYAA
jgi:hypothetical protein